MRSALIATCLAGGLVGAGEVERLTVTPPAIFTVRGQRVTCTATAQVHCWQTGRWPRLEWALMKAKLHVWRTNWPGGPAEEIYVAER